MEARTPGIQLNDGELIWSKVPEFSMAYNGFSVVIPHVEYYLNHIMGEVRERYGKDDPELNHDLQVFIQQEAFHSRYHNRFNKRMYAAGYEGLKALVARVDDDLKRFRETKSLAFNVAYCTGFESIATYDSQYIFNACDEFFEGCDPHGANLLLWHVAEEFEHRTVCHDAFKVVSGNYFMRIYGMIFAFLHIGSAFMEAKKLILEHHYQTMSTAEIAASKKRVKKLFWREIRYLAPRMLKIFLPYYEPKNIQMPPRIARALEFFKRKEPIDQRVELAVDL